MVVCDIIIGPFVNEERREKNEYTIYQTAGTHYKNGT